jgi:hypothetical protein
MINKKILFGGLIIVSLCCSGWFMSGITEKNKLNGLEVSNINGVELGEQNLITNGDFVSWASGARLNANYAEFVGTWYQNASFFWLPEGWNAVSLTDKTEEVTSNAGSDGTACKVLGGTGYYGISTSGVATAFRYYREEINMSTISIGTMRVVKSSAAGWALFPAITGLQAIWVHHANATGFTLAAYHATVSVNLVIDDIQIYDTTLEDATGWTDDATETSLSYTCRPLSSTEECLISGNIGISQTIMNVGLGYRYVFTITAVNKAGSIAVFDGTTTVNVYTTTGTFSDSFYATGSAFKIKVISGSFNIDNVGVYRTTTPRNPFNTDAFTSWIQGHGQSTRGASSAATTPAVLFVTTTANTGAGSLRTALTTAGAKYVLSKVDGIIPLASDVQCVTPTALTLVGFTAPNYGITIASANLTIQGDEQIVSNIRVRMGHPAAISEANADGLQVQSWDSTDLTSKTDFSPYHKISNIVIDHCSLSWGLDGTLDSYYRVENATFQNNLIYEALLPHSLANLQGEGGQYITYYQNVHATSEGRMPTMKGGTVVEMINEIEYNYFWGGMSWGASDDAYKYITANVQYCWGVRGATSNAAAYQFVIASSIADYSPIYFLGNLDARRTSANSGDQWDYVNLNGAAETKYRSDTLVTQADSGKITGIHYPTNIYSGRNTDASFLAVLGDAGQSVPSRDAADVRIKASVLDGTGVCISEPAAVGNYPPLYNSTQRASETDTDSDGIPDWWENRYGGSANYCGITFSKDVYDSTNRITTGVNAGRTILDVYLFNHCRIYGEAATSNVVYN